MSIYTSDPCPSHVIPRSCPWGITRTITAKVVLLTSLTNLSGRPGHLYVPARESKVAYVHVY
jgi:hypothetical protein